MALILSLFFTLDKAQPVEVKGQVPSRSCGVEGEGTPKEVLVGLGKEEADQVLLGRGKGFKKRNHSFLLPEGNRSLQRKIL
jgi:hypothetical protein